MTARVVGRVLLTLLLATGGASAFNLPTSRLAPQQHGVELNNGRSIQHVMSLSRENEDGDGEESRLPFLARALQRLRKKKETEPSEVAMLENTETKEKKERQEQKEKKNVDSEAAVMRALAEKMRLEAEKMDISLTLAKIDKLEKKIQIGGKDETSNLITDAQLLMKKIQITNGMTLANEGKSNLTSSSKDSLPPDKSPSISDSKPKGEKNIVQEIIDGDKPLLSDEKREEAIDSFDKLPQQIKDMMAKTVGMEDGTNATAVIEKLMEEDRLFEGSNDEQFSMTMKTDDMDLEEIFVDLEFTEMTSFVKNLLPEVTRKEPVKEEYIDALYSEVLGKDTFNPKERKPQAVPGGYLIRGNSRVRPKEGKDDGDVLVEALDEKISKSSVAGKIQAYYMLDPTPPSGEEILNEEDETPVLFITNYDISPDTEAWVKPVVTFVGLSSLLVFSLGSYVFDQDIVDRINAPDGSLDFLYDLTPPLAIAVLGTQLAHEAGHLIIALKDGIQIGLPTIVPGYQFGISGGLTPIKSSPKNIKSLFDFAIAGPLFGFAASIVLLYSGLEMTAFIDPSARDQLPSVPVEILRSSALGGGIIDYLLGDGVLNSPDPSTDLIKLHPYAIAGFGGLVINALSLLPLGNTDGGRISLSFFGRSFSRVVQGTAILVLVIAGFFGADQANTLLCYAIYCNFFQKEAEVPCRNEVDELDTARGFLAIGVSLIVMLTLIPLPQ
ncbi:hypothetical protein ACHAXR_012847 [Thalassiosira sp. AJA248-18]